MITLTSFVLPEAALNPGWVIPVMIASVLVFMYAAMVGITNMFDHVGNLALVVAVILGVVSSGGMLYSRVTLDETQSKNQEALSEVVWEIEDSLEVEFLDDGVLDALNKLVRDTKKEYSSVEDVGFAFEGNEYTVDLRFKVESLDGERVVTLWQVDTRASTSEDFSPLAIADAVSEGK